MSRDVFIVRLKIEAPVWFVCGDGAKNRSAVGEDSASVIPDALPVTGKYAQMKYTEWGANGMRSIPCADETALCRISQRSWKDRGSGCRRVCTEIR